MPDVTLALNSQTTPRADFAEFAVAAADYGFDGVECSAGILPEDPSRATDILARHELALVGVCPSEAVVDWHWAWDDLVETEFRAELVRARQIGAGYFVMPFMRGRGDAATVRRGLGRAVPIARDVGMVLAVEPIGHFDVVRRAEELAPLLREHDPEIVGVLLDSFHFFRAGHDLEALNLYADLHVAGIQLSNINGVPVAESFGYRDRTFPLDGPWDVRGFARRAHALFPDAPLIVEVIGDLAQSTPTNVGAERASAQLADIVRTTVLEAPRG